MMLDRESLFKLLGTDNYITAAELMEMKALSGDPAAFRRRFGHLNLLALNLFLEESQRTPDGIDDMLMMGKD